MHARPPSFQLRAPPPEKREVIAELCIRKFNVMYLCNVRDENGVARPFLVTVSRESKFPCSHGNHIFYSSAPHSFHLSGKKWRQTEGELTDLTVHARVHIPISVLIE